MSDIIEVITIEEQGIKFEVEVRCYGGAEHQFNDQWEQTDKHQGGVTIRNPHAERERFAYYIPKQYTLAQLTKDYAIGGRENPSKQAYDSLQRQLIRDIDAGDYGLRYSASYDGIKIIADETCGIGFDWSSYDDRDLADAARDVWDEYAQDEALDRVQDALGELIAKMHSLVELGEILKAREALDNHAPEN